MKSIFLYPIFLLFITTNIFAQEFEYIHPKPIGNQIRDIFFINETKGWALTVQNTIHHSTDGGHTWEVQNFRLCGRLNFIFFLNELKGWAVGNDGCILLTSDGGENWTSIASGTNKDIQKVFFINGNNGFAAGRDEILRTTDGGNTWSIDFQVFGINSWIYDLQMDENQNAWMAVDDNYFHFSNDWGETWQYSYHPDYESFHDIHFFDSNNGKAIVKNIAGQFVLLKTGDGGENWELDFEAPNIAENLTFYDNLNGCMVGSNNRVYTTNNGGNTWTENIVNEIYTNGDISFGSANVGYVTSAHRIYKTLDSGVSWEEISEPRQMIIPINGVSTIDDENIWVAAEFIYKSSDGGATWVQQFNSFQNKIYDIQFITNLIGYASGKNGVILHTVDGGVTWEEQNSTTTDELFRVQFINENEGWVSGTGNYILKTTDGGINWSNKSIFPAIIVEFINDFHFIDNSNGWAVGRNGSAVKTIDGGENWTSINFPSELDLYDVFFLDSNIGWISGGGLSIWKTIDGGQSWTQQHAPPSLSFFGRAYNIHFFNELVGMVSGSEYMLFTTDGGENWDVFINQVVDHIKGFTVSQNNNVYIGGIAAGLIGLTLNDIINDVTDFQSTSSLIIYPNPAKDILNITLPNEIDSYEISIINNLGSVIKTISKNNSLNVELNTSFLPNGIYYLRALSKNNIYLNKIIIQR